MVELKNLGYLLETFLELLDLMQDMNELLLSGSGYVSYLLEVVSKFNDWCSLKHSLLVDDQLAMLEGVNVTLDQ